MPLYRRVPKRGFRNLFRKNYEIVNLDRLQKAIDDKKLDASAAITAETMAAAGLVSNNRDGVRLLGKGELISKVTIEVAGATKSAVAAVEKVGGVVVLPEPTKVELEAREKSAKSQAKKRAAEEQKSTVGGASDDQLQAKHRFKVWAGIAHQAGRAPRAQEIKWLQPLNNLRPI